MARALEKDAAEAYSVEHAYHDHDFPFVGTDARCPLCQQTLELDATQRLARFKSFVQDETATRARASETEAQKSIAAVSDFEVVTVAVSTALASIEAEDPGLADELRSVLESAGSAKQRIGDRLRGESAEPPISFDLLDTDELRTSAEAFRARASAIDPTQFAEQLKSATAKKWELSDRIELAKHATALKVEGVRLREFRDITALRGGITAQPITKQSTALTRTYVNDRVNDRFARETDRLGLGHVSSMTRAAAKAGCATKPALLGASLSTKSVRDVLSEGERAALGLAGLLTEVNFDASASALVLDDPITSLDHGRREKVAKRITQYWPANGKSLCSPTT